MDFTTKARELSDIIKNTREYLELKQAKTAIDANREVKSKVTEFKKREQEYMTRGPGKETDALAAELGKTFEYLSLIPEVSRFLKAEKDFSNLMSQVYKVIGDSIQAGLK